MNRAFATAIATLSLLGSLSASTADLHASPLHEVRVHARATGRITKPPIVWKPVPRASCSNRYISTVATTSRASVESSRKASRERRNLCVREAPRRTIASSVFM